MFKALIKANNEVLSFCKCDAPLATSGQADCPWCGCGWMFTCMECRKAFIFAKVVETKLSPREIVLKDLARWELDESNVEETEIAEQVNWLADQLDALQVGDVCVILDGKFIPATKRDVEFSGWYSKHSFRIPPQVEAISDTSVFDRTLKQVGYWLERQIPEE